jgi:hypothetical protein
VFYDLLQENEYSDTSESECSSDNNINANISSSDHSLNSEDIISDNSIFF